MKRAYTAAITRASSTRTPWGWAAGGVFVGLFVAIVAFAPARWLAQGLDQASGGQVNLVDAQGTVWQGSARLVLAGGQDSVDAVALPGRLAWQVDVRSGWILGPLQAAINAPCCMSQPLKMQAHWGSLWGLLWGAQASQITLDDHVSTWPAKLLSGLGTPWNTVQADGQLALSLQGLSLQWQGGRWVLAGRVQLDALQMASRLSTLKPMGSYRLSLSTASDAGQPAAQAASPLVSRLTLETLQGSSLQLSGQGQWVGGRLRFDGVASAVPERAEALSNLLNIIGRRDGARSIIKVG